MSFPVKRSQKFPRNLPIRVKDHPCPAGFWIENLFPGEVKKLSTSFSVRNLNKNKMWAEIVIQDYTGLFPIQPTGSQSFFSISMVPPGRRSLYGKNKSSSMSDDPYGQMAWKIYPYGEIIHYFTTPTYVDNSQMLHLRCTRHIVTFTNACSTNSNQLFCHKCHVTVSPTICYVIKPRFLIGPDCHHQWINISMNFSDSWQIS